MTKATDVIDRWLKDGWHNTQETDVDGVTKSINTIYARLDCPPPYIIWCDSPLQLMIMPFLMNLACLSPPEFQHQSNGRAFLDAVRAQLDYLNKPFWQQAAQSVRDHLTLEVEQRLLNGRRATNSQSMRTKIAKRLSQLKVAADESIPALDLSGPARARATFATMFRRSTNMSVKSLSDHIQYSGQNWLLKSKESVLEKEQTYRFLGMCKFEVGEIEEAKTYFEKAHNSDPTGSDSLALMSLANNAQKDYDKAFASATKAIQLYPGHSNAYLARAEASLGKEHYDKALSDCQSALSLKNPQGLYVRGLILEAQDNTKDATTAYREFVAQMPPRMDDQIVMYRWLAEQRLASAKAKLNAELKS